jgi:hypothetical protein
MKSITYTQHTVVSSTIWGISPTKLGQMTQIYCGTTDNGEFNANKRYAYQRLTGILLFKAVWHGLC